jgi:hypothetical protein
MLYKKSKKRRGLKQIMPRSGGFAGSIAGSHPGQAHASRRKRANQTVRRKQEQAEASAQGLSVIELRALQRHIVLEVLAQQRRTQPAPIAGSWQPQRFSR